MEKGCVYSILDKRDLEGKKEEVIKNRKKGRQWAGSAWLGPWAQWAGHSELLTS